MKVMVKRIANTIKIAAERPFKDLPHLHGEIWYKATDHARGAECKLIDGDY